MALGNQLFKDKSFIMQITLLICLILYNHEQVTSLDLFLNYKIRGFYLIMFKFPSSLKII